MNQPTKYPELNHVLDELVKRLKSLLGDQLLAVYLQGSFALGAGDNDSDVDFLVLIEDDISDDLWQALEALHRGLFDIPVYWSQHLEGSYLPKTLLNERAPFTPIVYIDNGSKHLERSTHDNNLVVRWVTRERGITLYGAEPKIYFDPVSSDELKNEVTWVMQGWGGEILRGDYIIDNIWAQAFAVIMYCRMLHTLETGEIRAKPEAVQWALNTLDQEWHDLLRVAWQNRANQYEKVSQAAPADDVARSIDFIRYALKLSNQ